MFWCFYKKCNEVIIFFIIMLVNKPKENLLGSVEFSSKKKVRKLSKYESQFSALNDIIQYTPFTGSPEYKITRLYSLQSISLKCDFDFTNFDSV